MSRLSDDELISELIKRFEEQKKAVDQLKELTNELQMVNSKLTESESLKSHFISNISNELVNPFTSIICLAKSIMSVPEGQWHKIKAMGSLLHSEAFSLDFQLKNIFEAAAIEAGEVSPQFVNVEISQLINQLVEYFAHECEKKQLQVEVIDLLPKEEVFHFYTDSEKLFLVLSNLLDNAIKSSNLGSKIEIKAWYADEELRISVQDHGAGISEKYQKQIFDRFARLDTSINSKNRGHGLGLSIVKAIMEILEGRIEVSSAPVLGSNFMICLPKLDSIGSDDYSDGSNNVFFGSSDQLF